MLALAWWQWVASWAAGGAIGLVVYFMGEAIRFRRAKRGQDVSTNDEDPSEEGSPGT